MNSTFNLIKEIADKAEYYNALSTINKYTIARILYDAGYCSSFVKRINCDYPKRYYWNMCRETAINICRYCQAVSSFMAGDKYAVQIDGTLIDNEYSEVVYYPKDALQNIIDYANLLNEALREVYNSSTRWKDSNKILHLAQFTDGISRVVRKASGRKKAAKVMALYREAIRHRNTHWTIKHDL